MVKEKKVDVCESVCMHEDHVGQVAEQMPDISMVEHLADLYKMFADPTRVRILWALSTAELCVCDISALLDVSQSAISHQLRLLKQARLVRNRRDGRVIYYSLDDDHVRQIFRQGVEHIMERGD